MKKLQFLDVISVRKTTIGKKNNNLIFKQVSQNDKTSQKLVMTVANC